MLTRPAESQSLTRYLQAIYAYPMLPEDEEIALARAWRDRQDQSAAHRLTTSHLRLVARIAMGYSGYSLPLGELISEGNIGLMQALRRFDPERSCRFSTYAAWWIRAEMQEYILRSQSLVRMGTTAGQKKLFFKLRRLKGEMHALDDGDLSPDQVAKIMQMLGVQEHEVITMNRRLAVHDSSLNVSMYRDVEEQWQDWLVDDARDQESVFAEHEEMAGRRQLLGHALRILDKRERSILTERWLKEIPTTLSELALRYNISRERVRQIQIRALAKLRTAMTARPVGRALVSCPRAPNNL